MVVTFEDAANEAANKRKADEETYLALIRASEALDMLALKVEAKMSLEGEDNYIRSLAYSQAATLLQKMANKYREGSLDWDVI